MKKPTITLVEEIEPKKTQRADVPPASGFTLVVDGHFKNNYDEEAAAQKAGAALLAQFPMLQIMIYDAATRTRSPLQQAVPE